MANVELNKDELARMGLKNLIVKFNESGGNDQKSVQMILEYLSKTPMYFAVKRMGENMAFITLQTGGKTFVPIFTSPDEMGKVKEQGEVVLLKPLDFFTSIVDAGYDAVVNPNGQYFLLWPELMKEHMLPAIQAYDMYENAEDYQIKQL